MKKALLFGDSVSGESVYEFRNSAIADAIDDYYETDVIREGVFSSRRVKGKDLVITCRKDWIKTDDKKAIAQLYTYVLNGGHLFCIHEGTKAHGSHELCNITGARYESSQPFTYLEFSSENESFVLEDEPYRYTFDAYTDKQVWLEYSYGVLRYPAMWAHSFGYGKVVCMMPGVSAYNLTRFPVKKLIYRAASWMAGKAEEQGI